MTITTKVEGRTYADLSVWGKRFDKRAMKELAGYLSCGNMGASQALAFAANDPATTGTKPIMINGHTQLCIAEADADWSDAATASTLVAGNARGIVMANGYSQWLICFARSTGLLRIDTAGTYALDASVVTEGVIIPHWDSSVWAPIALFIVDAGGAVTLGTTDISAITTIHQLLSPVLPDSSVLQAN
jgi:hypothetical protein